MKTTSYLISTDGVSSTIITRELKLADGLVKKKNFFLKVDCQIHSRDQPAPRGIENHADLNHPAFCLIVCSSSRASRAAEGIDEDKGHHVVRIAHR